LDYVLFLFWSFGEGIRRSPWCKSRILPTQECKSSHGHLLAEQTTRMR
jgi:hypothetical protein